jgi:hypothetical protein
VLELGALLALVKEFWLAGILEFPKIDEICAPSTFFQKSTKNDLRPPNDSLSVPLMSGSWIRSRLPHSV